MKKYILSVLLLFNAILLAFGVGVFSVENIKPTNFASVQSEQEIISQEPPTELADLQKAGSGQLDYWAENLDAFDGRDFGFVTPARSQGSKNICWAYAAVGAVEASILREGIDETATKETLNFDEMIAAYTSLNRDGGPDPLLLTTNDKFNYGTWNQGGHSVNALAIMTQGYTLVDEKYFYTSIDESALKNALEQSKYYVQSYKQIQNNQNAIKRAILQYGAVVFSYNAPGGFIQRYYNSAATINHASIIVGWDDTISKANFTPQTPTSDGAWIVKNSWGAHGKEKNGTYCYYASYQLPISSLYAVDMAMSENYQNIYHYDGQIANSLKNFVADKQAAIYEAKLSTSTKEEQLTATSFFLSQGDVEMNIKVYKNLSVNPGNVNDAKNIPEQGEPVADKTVHIDRPGYHTVEFDNPISLEQGEYFSIVTSGKGQFNQSVMISCASDGGKSVNDMTYHCFNGEWTSYKKSNYYADSSTDNMSARIRAITNTVDRESDLGEDLQYARVEIENRLVYYVKGKVLIPDLKVYFGETLLEQGQDYTVSFKNNNVPGMVKIEISGIGSYYGSRETYFEIAKAKEPPGALKGTIDVYNNIIYLHDIPIPTDWQWIDTNKKLDFGKTDYQVSLKYVGADKEFYQITTCDFYVNKINQAPPANLDISTASVEIEGEYRYTGQPIVPNVKVTRENIELHSGIDYTLILQNNTNAGRATVTVQGCGRYTGQAKGEFEIQKAEWPADKPNDTIKISRRIKNTNQILLNGNWTWQESQKITDDNFSAVAIYTGQDRENFANIQMQITIIREPQVDIASITELKLEQTSFEYDGTAKMPNVVAKDGTLTLLKDTDFEVEYFQNTNVGQASVLVRGIDAYSGSITLTFTITRANRTGFKVVQDGWIYGNATPPNPRVEGTIEESNVVYTYSNSQNGTYSAERPTNAGTYWIKAVIEQSQNCNSAEAKTSFTIEKADHPKQMPSTEMTVGRKIKTLQSVQLIDGWSWESPSTKIDKETIFAYAIYSDKNNYENYKVQIEITKKPPTDISTLSVELSGSDFEYDGKEKTPNIVAKDGEYVLVAGTDYDVEYESNKLVGQAKAIVLGKNDYSGRMELVFTISRAEKPNVSTTIRFKKNATKLSDIPLPKGFVWEDENIEITGKSLIAKAIYEGEDKDCYEIKELYFEIIIDPQDETLPVWIWIALAVSATAFLGGVATFVGIRHRKKKRWQHR